MSVQSTIVVAHANQENSLNTPFNEVLEMLRDQGSKPIFDFWDILRICRASARDLVILETFSRIIVTTGSKTL